jgi:hypothetical protein
MDPILIVLLVSLGVFILCWLSLFEMEVAVGVVTIFSGIVVLGSTVWLTLRGAGVIP